MQVVNYFVTPESAARLARLSRKSRARTLKIGDRSWIMRDSVISIEDPPTQPHAQFRCSSLTHRVFVLWTSTVKRFSGHGKVRMKRTI
jgi:hypothetical protein